MHDLILLAKGESCTGRISAFGLDSICTQSVHNRPRTDILPVWTWASLVTEIGDLLYNCECLEKTPQSQTGKTPQMSGALALLVESQLVYKLTSDVKQTEWKESWKKNISSETYVFQKHKP